MIELEDRIRRYAEAVADASAMGPDPAETDGEHPNSARSGRMVLVACLVALVAVVGGLVVVAGRDETPPSTADQGATASKAGEQLSASLTVENTEVPFGGTITAHGVLTNTSADPITVVTPPGFVLSVSWGSYSDRGPAPAPTTLERVGALYGSAPFQPPAGTGVTPLDTLDPRARVTLAPGESTTVEGTYTIGETSRTGPVEVAMVPTLVKVIDGKEATGPLSDMRVAVPVTVGPAPAGTITMPDAIAAALADPQVVRWGAAIDANDGLVGAGASNVERTSYGWRLLYGATDGDASGDLATELRQFGGPGLIVRVDGDRTVTVEWIAAERGGT